MDRAMKVQTRKYVAVPDVVRIEPQGGVRGTPKLQCGCSREIVTNLPKINWTRNWDVNFTTLQWWRERALLHFMGVNDCAFGWEVHKISRSKQKEENS